MIAANKVASPRQAVGIRGNRPLSRPAVRTFATQKGKFTQNQQDDGRMKHMVEDENEKVRNIQEGMAAAQEIWDNAKDSAGDLVEGAKEGLLKQAETARNAPSHMRGADENKRLDDMARYKAAEIDLDKGR